MSARLFSGLILITALGVGCAGGSPDSQKSDSGTDAQYTFEPDMGDSTDMAEPRDTGGDAPDADVVDPPESGPLEVLAAGAMDRVLLKGTVLTPEGVIQEGEVLIEGQFIRCVATSCSAQLAAEGATIIDTKGIISPGLIDAHNHIAYNFLPEWDTGGRFFNNRYEWADDPSYEAHIEPYSANRNASTHFCPAAKWGEWRGLINGTTTIQGQAFNQNCIDGWVRNADADHRLQYDHMRTTIASPRDIDDETAANFRESIDDPVMPITRIAVHMAEGLSGDYVDEEFDSYAGRDERPNRHEGISLLYKETAILIHSIAVTTEHIHEMAETGSKVVWSPSSNIVLYNETADIREMLEAGVTVGLGPDWTLSGEDDMLGEMGFALDYAARSGLDDIVTPKKVWEMATSDGAIVVGLQDHIGQLKAGMRADITVFSRTRNDPYEAVARNRADDVRLVFIDGEAYYGEVEARATVARNQGCEALEVCGKMKFFCGMDNDIPDGRRTYAEVEESLIAILEGTGFPADEQYGRGEDLLPLWSCE